MVALESKAQEPGVAPPRALVLHLLSNIFLYPHENRLDKFVDKPIMDSSLF